MSNIFGNNYSASLAGDDFTRYKVKVALCEGIDPYTLNISDLSTEENELPAVAALDLLTYLVDTTDFLTKEQFKAYKSTEAHTFFTDGWIQWIKTKCLSSGNVIVCSKVRHSQCTSEPPLNCWLLGKRNGEIITGHCMCMAGNSGACSHVGAILFALEYFTKLKEAQSCTSKLCSWLPAHVSNVQCAEVRSYDFTSAKAKHERLMQENSNPLFEADPDVAESSKLRISDERFSQFLEDIVASGNDCGSIFRVLPKYSDKYIPEKTALQSPLSNLYQPSSSKLSFQEILLICSNIFESLKITKEDAVKVEEMTRGQSSNTEWKSWRTGMITASVMKGVCSACDLLNPPITVLKKICYPMNETLKTRAMERGADLEPKAYAAYVAEMEKIHVNFTAINPGFFINHQYPFMGASPDALTRCDCHGQSIAELKCPSSENDYIENGTLPSSHQYYYQVQTQLLVLGLEKGDFVVYRPEIPLKIVSLKRDVVIQDNIIRKSEAFLRFVILPELVAKFFTSNQNVLQNLPKNLQNIICICRKPPFGRLIICAKSDCITKAFHFPCVGVKRFSRKWFCSACATRNKK